MSPLAWQFKAVTLAVVVAVPVWRGAACGGATSGWGSTDQVRREGPTRAICCMVFTALAHRAPGLPHSGSEPSWGAMASSTPELGALTPLISWPSTS